ncbi:MAG TPA: UDP-N-acetylmuramate dehydrogenase [Pseudomonadaceae bacterium]|nr:UDP-N-acetylmuramate dehydrogenase [Pseudomonadaceae bacterium]
MPAPRLPIAEYVELRHLNTFHVGATARYHARVATLDELRQVLAWIKARALPFLILGQGSNILFRQDYPGVIVELHLRGIEVLRETDDTVDIRVMAGEVWHELVLFTLAQGYAGLENMSLIPGTVGAAPVQNIGAYGRELADVLLSLDAMELESGLLHQFDNAACGFAYRSSVFKRELVGQYVICSLVLRLSRQDRIDIHYPALQQALGHLPAEQLNAKLVSDTVCRIRRSKLPDPDILGNAGSFFWNPLLTPEQYVRIRQEWPDMPAYAEGEKFKVPAAWLIERAGWKGYRDGDVGVHEHHALVLVNYGAASGAELVQLATRIQASVQNLFDIGLQPEVRII